MSRPVRSPNTTRTVVAVAAAAGSVTGLVVGLALVGAAEGPATGVVVRWGLPAARTALDIAGVVVVGSTLLPWLLRDARSRDRDPAVAVARRAGIVAAAVWAGLALVLVLLQAARATGVAPLALPVDRVGDYLRAAVAGRALLLVVACGIAVIAASTAALRERFRRLSALPVIPAALGLLALPVTGHAATAPAHELAVLAVAGHVLAAGAWLGGLGMLLAIARRRELLAAALPRFSRLAAWCLLTVAASGVLNAVLRLPSVSALLSGAYGWLLLGKIAGVIALAGLGGWARRRVVPAVAARRTGPLVWWAAAEVAAMGAVLALAAVLAETPPATA